MSKRWVKIGNILGAFTLGWLTAMVGVASGVPDGSWVRVNNAILGYLAGAGIIAAAGWLWPKRDGEQP